MSLEAKSSSGILQVPYWAWDEKQRDVLAVLGPLADEDDFQFAWPLLADALPICRAAFSADALEIEAPCLPSDVLNGFSQAGHRIYLTATLADDAILVSDLGADPEAVADPITPASAGDIGDRLILVPQQTHPDWFGQTYGAKATAVAVLIHPRAMFDKKAAVPTGSRVVNKEKLEALRDALHAYATALADSDTFRDAAGVGRLLSRLGLTAGEFINRYTTAPMQDH